MYTGRLTSLHITVLITLERYLVIAYPLRSRLWFSLTRSKLQVIFIVVYDLLVCIPKYTSLHVGENIYSDKKGGLNVPCLAKSDYIFMPSKWHKFWSNTLGKCFAYYLYLVDILVSNLILLLFNIWSLHKVGTLFTDPLI